VVQLDDVAAEVRFDRHRADLSFFQSQEERLDFRDGRLR
jgi:hypothetical protein